MLVVCVRRYRMDVTKHANYVPLLGDLAHADSHTQPQQHKQSHPSQRRALREAEQPKHQNTTQQRTEVPRAPPKESPLVMVVRPLHPARDEDHALFMAQTVRCLMCTNAIPQVHHTDRFHGLAAWAADVKLKACCWAGSASHCLLCKHETALTDVRCPHGGGV